MSIGLQTFRGERLREARLSRGLFMNALGDLLDITGSAVSRYEQNEDKPLENRVHQIARILGFPYEFFLSEPWPEDIELVHWRQRAADTKSAREMTEQRMKWLCEVFSYLETYVEFPEPKIPSIQIPDDFRLITQKHIEEATRAIRHDWGVGDEPVPDMILALENMGIPVACLELPSDKQDGFTFRSNLSARHFVGINTHNVSCARARFDAAHELAHIVLHSRVTPTQAKDSSFHKILEQQAHAFAGALLFPRESFYREVHSVSLDYFCALKKRWGMSIGAMIMRAYALELIDEESKSLLFRKMTRRRWRGVLKEPYDHEMDLEKPRMLKRGFEAMLDVGFFANNALLSSLPIPTNELELLAGLEKNILRVTVTPQPEVCLRVNDLESGNIIEFPRKSH